MVAALNVAVLACGAMLLIEALYTIFTDDYVSGRVLAFLIAVVMGGNLVLITT